MVMRPRLSARPTAALAAMALLAGCAEMNYVLSPLGSAEAEDQILSALHDQPSSDDVEKRKCQHGLQVVQVHYGFTSVLLPLVNPVQVRVRCQHPAVAKTPRPAPASTAVAPTAHAGIPPLALPAPASPTPAPRNPSPAPAALMPAPRNSSPASPAPAAGARNQNPASLAPGAPNRNQTPVSPVPAAGPRSATQPTAPGSVAP